MTPPRCDILSTLNLTLEPITQSHAEQLYAGLALPESYAYIPEEPPESLELLRERYRRLERRQSPDGTQAWLNWAIRTTGNGRYQGYVQATVAPADRLATIAYFVFPYARRRGIGKQSMRAVIDYLFNIYDVLAVEANVDTRNAASIALTTSIGFTLVETVRDADFFKGSTSHEYRFRLTRHPSMQESTGPAASAD